MKKIKAFFSSFGDRVSKASPKKIALIAVCVLCFLIPTFLALSIVFADDSIYIPDSLSVELYDTERVLIAEESGEPNLDKHNSLVDIFYHIIKGSSKTEKPPIPPEESMPLYASVVYNGDRSEYVCYFSFLAGSSYYTDENGDIFLIQNSTAENFLSSIYAESIYTKAAPPKLYTNTGITILPSSASWFYRLYDDTYREALNYKTTTEAVTYGFSEVFDVRFEDEPDECTARVFENGSLIYEGSREALSKLMTNTSGSVRITLEAKWKQTDGVLFHGDVSYSFDAVLLDRSAFSVNRDTLTKSGFIILTCTNINDISKIVFKADNDYKPVFCKTGNGAQALIPYPPNVSKSTFDITVSYGASSRSFSIKLEDTLKATPCANEFNTLLRDISAKASNTVYFRGNIASPLGNGFSAGYAFGDTVNGSVTANGNAYVSANGAQSVGTICGGKVIATGYCEPLGNYIVVDHGLGLLSWYCHLSDFDSFEGKTLALGDSVGKTGSLGYTDNDGFLLLITLNGQLLDPSVIIEQNNKNG